jgi:DNA-binding LytR/AlgR family response regulator
MKCILVDDEPLARIGLEKMLQNIAFVEIVGSFSNALEANDFLKTNEVDLMFLDIQMPLVNGLDFTKSLTVRPLAIFITAFPQYALESYELDAIDYLLKPIRFDRLLKSVNKAENYWQLLQKDHSSKDIPLIEKDHVFVKSDKRFVKIYFHEILYIEGLKDYVIIKTANKKTLTSMNIKTIFSQLPESIFSRISKSFIVNNYHITAADMHTVYIQDTEIPIGELYRNDFYEKYINDKIIKK